MWSHLTISLLLVFALQWQRAAGQNECSPLFYPEACFTDRLVLERHSFVDNLRKEVACYVRGHSSESIIIHVLVQFADPVNHFHNALLLNPTSVEKYSKILRESEFAFNNELRLLVKGQESVVQYDVAQEAWQLRLFEPASTDVSLPPYDAVLSLDYYASLWSEYNAIVLERSRLSLRMREPPFDQDLAVDNEDYDGFYKLWCNQSASVKRCHVLLPPAADDGSEALWVNNRSYGVTGLVIDTGRSDNLLPYDVYVRWRYHGERNLRLSIPNQTDVVLLLHLNDQYEYDINRESGDIVLGVDFLLLFQKAEYCLEAGYYKVWYYNHLYSWHEQHLVNVTVICLFVSTLLSIFFYWVISLNYSVQDYVLDRKRQLEFPFDIVLCELVTYAVGVAVAVMALVFVDDVGALALDATGSKQRTVLFVTVLLLHLVIGLYYLAWLRRAQTRRAAQYYAHYSWHMMGRDRDVPRGQAIQYSLTATPGQPAKVRDVLVRNTCLNNVLSMSLLLIFNYLVEDRPLFLAVCVVVSAVATYYWLKMLLVTVQYLVVSQREHGALWRYEKRFMLMSLLSFALFIVYVVLAFPLVYLACFREFNSMYSDIFLWIFGIHLHCFIVLFAAGIVFIVTVRRYIQQHTPPTDPPDGHAKKD